MSHILTGEKHMWLFSNSSSNLSQASSVTQDCSESSEFSFNSPSMITSLDDLQQYEYNQDQENIQLAMALSSSLESSKNGRQEPALERLVEEEEDEEKEDEKEEIDVKTSKSEKDGSHEPAKCEEQESDRKHVAEEEGEKGKEDVKSSKIETAESAESHTEGRTTKKKSKKGKKKKKKDSDGNTTKKKDSDGNSTKKTKKKKKKKDSDGNSTKKTKKKKKTAVEDEVRVLEIDDQGKSQNKDMASSEVNVPQVLQRLTMVQEESPEIYMDPTEPTEKVYSPIFDSPGSTESSPTKPEQFPDTESIFSKLSEFEQAWREADNSRHEEKQEEPVSPEEEALSLADTILDSTASVGASTYGHGQFSIISTVPEERARDFRRQAISLAAAESRRRAETGGMSKSRNTTTSQHVNWRLPDNEDGTDQPIPNTPSSSRIIPPSQEGKQAYMEGVKATSILENKRHQPGAFPVIGPHDNPAEDRAGDVVVAALTQDDEAQIEKRVMQRLLKETAQASVIMVEHGGNSKKYEDPIGEAERQAELMENHKPQGLVEKILGDGQVPVDVNAAPDDFIKRRNHIPFTIKLHGTTNLWVTSVQTSQKAWDSSQYMYENTSLELKRTIKTYIATTEQEAYEIGLAMAPPIMNSVDENPICQLCSSKFALLKRPCQCRNCGVVICSSCSCSWSSKQVPSTYISENHKNPLSNVNVCVACDWLATSFREALLEGNLRKAQSLYNTGNVNLRKVYGADKKNKSTILSDEAMYPIQMAVRGGSLSVVKWLMFEHYCPLYESNNRGKVRTLLKTSKGRTVVDLALEQPKPEILKFLVTNQGVSLTEGAKKENRDSLKHLMCLVRLIPETMLANVSVNDTFPRIERDIPESPPDSSKVNNNTQQDNDGDQCAF